MKLFTKLVQTGFSQAKNTVTKGFNNPKTMIFMESSKNSQIYMTKNVGFGITHAKHVS